MANQTSGASEMTTRDIGAIIHSLCIVTAVMACASWPGPPAGAGVPAMPATPVCETSAPLRTPTGAHLLA
jgi:hypothetical protein